MYFSDTSILSIIPYEGLVVFIPCSRMFCFRSIQVINITARVDATCTCTKMYISFECTSVYRPGIVYCSELLLFVL